MFSFDITGRPPVPGSERENWGVRFGEGGSQGAADARPIWGVHSERSDSWARQFQSTRQMHQRECDWDWKVSERQDDYLERVGARLQQYADGEDSGDVGPRVLHVSEAFGKLC